jgi:acyl carrier protein
MDEASERIRPERAQALLSLLEQLQAELHPGQARRAIALDSRLEQDLGLDSLGRVELFGRVQDAFARELPERALEDVETVGDLLRLLGIAQHELPAGGESAETVAPEVQALPAPASLATLTAVLAWHADRHGERTHVHFYGSLEQLSYAGLLRGAQAVAAALQQRQVRPGQTVGLMLPSGSAFFCCFFGCLLAGAVPVPLYPPSRRSRLAEHLLRQVGILNNAEAVLLITFNQAELAARLLEGEVASLSDVVDAETLLAHEAAPAPVRIDSDALALLQYTSGSTGAPKGVMLTHAQLLANVRAMGTALALGPDDVCVSWLPLYHDMGLIGAWLGSLVYAVPLVLMSPLTFLARPERWLRAIHDYRGTLSAAPNFAYELCLRKIKDTALAGLDLSSWRVAFNGAEPVSADTVLNFSRRFRRYGFRRDTMMPVYGMAECGVGLAFPPLGRGPLIERVDRSMLMEHGLALKSSRASAIELVGCGYPLPGYQIRVADARGHELPERRQGHLQFRGPSATAGYYRNPAATAELRRGDWLDTGDLGYIAGGEVFVTGRIKDIVIRAGRNLYPQELEEAVGRLDGVRSGCVAVFACPDPRSGTEQLVVVAETDETDPERRATLRAEIDQLAFQLLDSTPDAIVLAPRHAVLKTSSGKIRRAATRDAYLAGRLEERPWRARWLLVKLAGEYALRALRRQAELWGFAARCWTVIVLGALLLLPLLAVLPSLDARRRLAHRLARLAVKGCGISLTVLGCDHIPRERPCVYVSNHASYLDGLVLTAALPPTFTFGAKRELAGNPLLGFVLKRIGTQFIDRFAIRSSLGDAQRLLKLACAGESLLFFPEGTLSREPGLRPFHSGAFMVAAEAQLPVVPVVLRGTRSMLRDGQWLPLDTPLAVDILAPIMPRGTDWGARLELRERVRAAMLARCDEPDLAAINRRRPPQ